MSRYYTCAKCDGLAKEGENCQTCEPTPKPVFNDKNPYDDSSTQPTLDWIWCSEKGWVIEDANYCHEDDDSWVID